MAAPASIQSGTSAELELKVANTSDAGLSVWTVDPPEEFVIRDSHGEEVWSSLVLFACPNGIPFNKHNDDCMVYNGWRSGGGPKWTFEAGEVKLLKGEWDTTTSRGDLLPPGEYSLTGTVTLAESDLVTEPLLIRVTP